MLGSKFAGLEMRVSSKQWARGAERVEARTETAKGKRRVDGPWHRGQEGRGGGGGRGWYLGEAEYEYEN